jgi:hypothetical protein
VSDDSGSGADVWEQGIADEGQRGNVAMNSIDRRLARLRAPRALSQSSLARRRFSQQRWCAKQRNIPFRLTFEEWWSIWELSGHWHERGYRRGQYCMARYGDQGAYEVGNVRICLVEENYAELLRCMNRTLFSACSKTIAARRGQRVRW